MSGIVPVQVPTVHDLHETLRKAHAKHQAIHRAHHHLATQIARLRADAVAAGQAPPISTLPSGPAAGEGAPPVQGGLS